MYPSLLAKEAEHALTEYLSTTFALAEDEARTELQRFLSDPTHGIFRGPYLRIRTPFQAVEQGWRSPLDWLPSWFSPYRHQAQAFERLSTRHSPAQPTIVTTGTGSGKTESFLYPLLDHAARAKARGESGIKAIILYPMNALVTDQGRRIAELLHDEPALRQVTAGVYIGGDGNQQQATRDRLVNHRQTLRDDPPDILLTNYKMLDLLLLREADAPLWRASTSSLRYLVLDEFHTYDGAQGTDVAMLLRRLGATLKVAEPGAPLGRITPVATSATLGGTTRSEELRSFAETVFGTEFEPGSVITEQRLDASEVVSDVDFDVDDRDVPDLTELPQPDAERRGSWQPLAHQFLTGVIPDEQALGRALSRSYLARAVVQSLSSGPLTLREAVDAVAENGPYQWGYMRKQSPEYVEHALRHFLALLSAARAPAGTGKDRPLLNLEVQLWVRAVSRLLRAVDRQPRFAWWDDGPVDDDYRYLPAAYCRVCGRSGWQAQATELGETLEGSPRKVFRAAVTDRASARTLLLADDDEPGARLIDPRTLAFCREGEKGLPVLITPDAEAAELQRCPSCGSDDSVRFLGSSVATLISVALTQLFGSSLVPDDEKKTLVFTDSVQDAAHRAAFIEGRAFQFNFRSAMLRALDGRQRTLTEVCRGLAGNTAGDLYAITPSDFPRRLGFTGEWLDQDRGRKRRNLLGERLAFQAQLEVGLHARVGRTLELTGALAVDYAVDLEHHAALVRAEHENLPERGMTLPGTAAYQTWILGLLDRLRRRGGIDHEWLTSYIGDDGKRWHIWGGSPKGMPKFPKGRAAPLFFTTGTKGDFDSLRPRGDSWLTDWTARCLGVSQDEARGLLQPVLRQLSEGDDAPLMRRTTRSDASVFGFKPDHLLLAPLDDEQFTNSHLRCPTCHHIQPVPPDRVQLWLDAPCPRMRCTGTLEPRPVRPDNFYRQLYQSGRLRHLVSHEHTAMLDDVTRQQVERSFSTGTSPIDPNVLTCTPTLELGIDIGDLSTVGLASLPRGPANYLQRVGRAGRSTGNALILATVPTGSRDLYYLSEPKHLIDGEITPPAAFLSATELLHRQYFAFCIDRVATGDIALDRDMPPRLGLLMEDGLEQGSWLRQCIDTVTARASELSEQFLQLYGQHLDEHARDSVRQFAKAGLQESVARVHAEWVERQRDLENRIQELSRSIAELGKQGHLDDGQQEDRKRWRGELTALRNVLHDRGRKDALIGLGELGLLPTYNLHDDSTELDVSLWWTTDDEGEGTLHTTEHNYSRGSRTALTEFAPGAVFYSHGYRMEIDAVDIGPQGQPHWRVMRLCPDCGWGTETVEPAPASCPRCGSAAVADTGAVHRVLELQRVSAVHRRDEAVIDDDRDERDTIRFTTITGVDIAPAQVQHAWRLHDRVFGAEYARQATVRTINTGRRERPGSDLAIAGVRESAPQFVTCTYCGVVWQSGPEDRVRHRGWCSTRRGTPVVWERLLLSHEITTQAVRMLLPVSTFHVESRLTSFKTALLLGLRRDFGGDPQHLEVVTAQMPDEQRNTRRFLVLHDTVPGGTGYLDRFGDPDRMRRILRQAHDALESCPCQHEGRAACHRCLLGVARRDEVEHANRRVAQELLADLLDAWEVDDVETVTGIDVSAVRYSELELLFREQLKQWMDDDPSQSWTGTKGPEGEELDIRLRGRDGSPRRWNMRPQQTVTAGGITTKPDFLLHRQDDQDAPVAIYLDGKAYHASAEHDRTADDARKRTALRDHGYRVWSLTWDDVEDFRRILENYESRQDELVDRSVRNAVRFQVTDPRAPVLWGNPMRALLEYLTDPAAAVWEQTAVQTCVALATSTAHGSDAPVQCAASELRDALTGWATGDGVASANGTVMLVSRHGRSGLPIAVVGDTQAAGTEAMGTLVVLDDRPSEVGGTGHEGQWRDWLRWSNLLQFLRLPRYGHELPLRMAECWSRQSLDEFRLRSIPLAAAAPDELDITIDVSHPEWKMVLEFTDETLHGVGRRLANLGVPEPEAGGEVGDAELWQVEYCWLDRRVAVVTDEEPQRDEWLARNGWRLLKYDGEEREDELVRTIAEEFGVAES
ncbi:DEAD/DEAH box helicase [Haloechinothrix sp. LS1_15]|uniref:DEAD/DEAH box helicase n=1 Tax=Haloechinothrix sp. LS1_15 TaxID=2652248 RepID=UPI0029456AEA|nr:DEAD/DEAH box helicase [Haloechinothrix sp. LS1_15]MDV6012304.1 DEAD/DEAH box helicase [Haloechinothrix sp. LS1_15]